MTEREIIHYIFQDEMPDIDQVRENCINSVSADSRNTHSRCRARTPLIAAIIAACALLSGIAYAGARMQWVPAERADSGGSWVMVSTIGDFHDNVGTEELYMIYSSLADEQPVFDSDIAERLTELMAGMFFTEEGEPIDLLVHGGEGYTADDRGWGLFDALGNRIDEVYYEANDNGIVGINSISFNTNAIEDLDVFPDSYDDAAGFLGNDFKIPSIYTDRFGPPQFKIQDEAQYGYGSNRKAVYVNMSGKPGIYFFVEQMRPQGEAAGEWAALGAEIFTSEIAGTAVYKITDKTGCQRYTWDHGGLTYMLFNYTGEPEAFSDAQCEEIIRSMIE